MKTMKVVIPGVLTTVQDLGRFGYQKSGMTCSGVMDTAAYRKQTIWSEMKREQRCWR